MDIRDLLDDHILASVDHQLAFSDLIGGAGYSVDLQNGSATLVGGRELRVGLIGSAAPAPGTWLWTWANPTSDPAPAKGASVSDTRCSRSGSTCIRARHVRCAPMIDFVRELPLAVALMEELLDPRTCGLSPRGA